MHYFRTNYRDQTIGLVIFTLLVGAVLCIDSARADDSTEAAGQTLTGQFASAYNAYESSLAADDKMDTLLKAKQALEIGEKLFDPDDENIAKLTYNYGAAALNLSGRERQAEKLLKLTLRRYERVYGRRSEKLIPVLLDLGSLGHSNLDYDKQKEYFNRARSIAAIKYGRSSIEFARLSLQAGVQVMRAAATSTAGRYLKDSQKIFAAELGTNNSEYALAAFNIGKYELARHRYDNARDEFLAALEIFKAEGGEATHPMEATTHAFLVQAYEELDDSKAATEHCLAIGRMTPFESNQVYLPIFRKSPRYPNSALRKGQEGQALLEFTVDNSGFVRNVKIVDVAGPDSMAVAAQEAVEEWRFAPRFIDGKPVDTEGVQTILTFEIAD